MPCHPRSLSHTSLGVKSLQGCYLFTIVLSPCDVPKCPNLHLDHLLHLWALPGSGDEDAGILKHTLTHKHEMLPCSLETAHCHLPWHFPKSTALGISDLGQFNAAAFSKGITASVHPRTASPWTSEEPLRGSFSFSLFSLQRHQEEREQDRDWGQRQQREHRGRHCLGLFSMMSGEKTLQCFLLGCSLAPISNSIILQQHELGRVAHSLWAFISAFAKWLLLWRCEEFWQERGQPGAETNIPPRFILSAFLNFGTLCEGPKSALFIFVCLFVCFAFQILGLICKVKQRERERARAVNFHNLRVFSSDLIMESDVWGPEWNDKGAEKREERLYTGKPNNQPLLNNH